MKAYTCNRSVVPGIALKDDDRLGKVVFLGEDGRGRRYEKVAVDRFFGPVIKDGKVMEADPKKVILPAREGKPEKIFYALTKPKTTNSVLVRVDTEGCYTKNSQGRFSIIAGSPETLVSGSGAYGDAGRIGGWSDSLVVMKPGDVIKVTLSGGSKFETMSLWYDEKGLQMATWAEYETIKALMHAQAVVPETLNFLSGMLPAFTWSHGRVEEGIELVKGSTGKVVSLGQDGRGRKLTELPLMGLEPGGMLKSAAVVVLEEKVVRAQYSWEQDKTVCKYGLMTDSDKTDTGFLVKITTSWVYTRGSRPEVTVWKGSPSIFAEGRGAEGAAGGIYDWPEVTAIMHEGDVIYVRPEGGRKTSNYALFVKNGKLQTEVWRTWKRSDMQSDPAFYIAKGTAPWGMVPAEWIGKVVSVVCLRGTHQDGYYLEEAPTGEIIKTNPLVLNLGWDGQDYHAEEVGFGDIFWVKLETEKQVRRLEGEQLEKRVDLRTQADALKNKAIEVAGRNHFKLAMKEMRDMIQEIGNIWNLDIMFSSEMEGWVSKAETTLKQFEAAEAELIELEACQTRGEILVDFGGHFRRMGAASNEDRWVIMPDGSCRTADWTEYRKRYTSEGDKGWRMVTDAELALSWCGDLSCRVEKMPVGGCTPEQLATVKKIELEDLGIPENSFGLDAGKADDFAKKLEEVSKACKRFTPFVAVPAFDWLDLTSNSGVMVDDENLRVQPRQMTEMKGYKKVEISGRYGRLIAQIKNVAGGTLQFIVFDKYGRQNLAVRWVSEEVQKIYEGLKDSFFLSRIPVIDLERILVGLQFDSSSLMYDQELIVSATQTEDPIQLDGKTSWPIEVIEMDAGRIVLYTIDHDGYEHYRLLVKYERE